MTTAISYFATTEKCTKINSVEIELFSPQEILRRAVVEVTESTIYEKNLPKENGINDPRMGVVSRHIRCSSCAGTVDTCPGHEGVIKLAVPVYHVGFVDTVFKILRMVCFWCSESLLDPNDKRISSIALAPNQPRQQRFPLLASKYKYCKRTCPHCLAKQPIYTKRALKIETSWEENDVFADDAEEKMAKKVFTSADAHSILLNVSDETYTYFGFNPKKSRPDWMIMTVMIVSVPAIRPSIVESEGSRTRGQDDLTHKLQDIIKINNEIKKIINEGVCSGIEPEEVQVKSEKLELLQWHTATYMNNEISGQKPSLQRSGAPTQSIQKKLKGKDGHIRGNLMGKRCNFTS